MGDPNDHSMSRSLHQEVKRKLFEPIKRSFSSTRSAQTVTHPKVMTASPINSCQQSKSHQTSISVPDGTVGPPAGGRNSARDNPPPRRTSESIQGTNSGCRGAPGGLRNQANPLRRVLGTIGHSAERPSPGATISCGLVPTTYQMQCRTSVQLVDVTDLQLHCSALRQTT